MDISLPWLWSWFHMSVCIYVCMSIYEIVYFNYNLWYVNYGSGEGNGTPFQYTCLENPMEGGAWKTAVHGVAKSWTWLSDFTFNFHFHGLEKEMATHSSVLAWRIPGTGEPGGLPSMGSHRVGHDWSDLAAAAAAVLCRKERILLTFVQSYQSSWNSFDSLLRSGHS